MPLAISFELSDSDLEHFNTAIKAAAAAAASRPAEEVLDGAAKLLKDADTAKLPEFIVQRLDRLDALIAMVRDEGWALPGDDRQRVMAALAYFADPDDIIPDHVPVLGYFDDAIAIELCVRELHHELDAYGEFCDFRQGEADRRGMEPASVGRADWLNSRRDELQERMHRERSREAGTGYGHSSGYARASYTKAWRPGIMRVR
jgi:uncharacterized membrane protein YkvA (DUF1232 family)